MSERWDSAQGKWVSAPDIDAFIADIVEVCRKHNMALGHEDTEGGFVVARGFSVAAADWLSQAGIDSDPVISTRDWRVRQ